MYPNRSLKQRGASLMVALFVILIFGLLTAALARLLMDSGDKHTVEVLSLRALMAAQTGIEHRLQAQYPSGVWQSASCLQNDSSYSFSDEGLAGCRYDVHCQMVSAATSTGTQSVLRLSSTGRCGDDGSGSNADFAVSRTVVAEAFDGER